MERYPPLKFSLFLGVDVEDGELSYPQILLVSRLDVEDGEVSSPQILLVSWLDVEDGELSSP